MARCNGEIPTATKVDQSMDEFIDREAERCGVSRAELIRLLFDDVRDSRNGDLRCPQCHGEIVIDPCL